MNWTPKIRATAVWRKPCLTARASWQDKVSGLESKGGWASVWMQASKQVKLTAGVGIDDPDDEELANNARSKNQAIFGNIRYTVAPAATIGLEVSHWSTDYRNAGDAETMRVQTSFIFGF